MEGVRRRVNEVWQQLGLPLPPLHVSAPAPARERAKRRQSVPSKWEQLGLCFPPAAPAAEEKGSRKAPLLITAFGETKTVYQWAAEQGISAQTIYGRLDAGYSHEAAVSTFRPSRGAAMSGADLAPGEPGALSWDLLEWEEDPWAWRVIDERGRMELEEIGELFALSKSRIEEIEKEAWVKVRCALELEEILGPERGRERWQGLRGKRVDEYLRAVERARKFTRWAREAEEAMALAKASAARRAKAS